MKNVLLAASVILVLLALSIDCPAKEPGKFKYGEACTDPFIIQSIPFTDDGDTTDAIDDYFLARAVIGIGAPDLVYKFRPTVTDLYRIRVTPSASYDVAVYVTTHCSDPNSAHTFIAGCDDNPEGVTEDFPVFLEQDNIYYIIIDGNRVDQFGAYNLEVSFNIVDCIDIDEDGYGLGPGCLGPDCDDNDPSIPGGLCDGPDNDWCEEGVWECDGTTPVCTDTTGDIYEQCNGIDDNCNGLVDQAEVPVSVLCPDVDHAIEDCAGASGCIITGCDAGFYDLDGIYANGCEYQSETPP